MKKIVIFFVVLGAIVAVSRSGLFSGNTSVSKLLISKSSTERTIDGIIKGGNSIGPSILRRHRATFKDYRVYKTADGKGVVYEYTLQEAIDPDELGLTAEKIKNNFLTGMRSNRNWSVIKTVLKKGIYFHVQYLKSDGDITLEFKVTSSDV